MSALVVLCCCQSSGVTAQETRVESGSRVRIQANYLPRGTYLIGLVQSYVDDTIRIATEPTGEVTAVPAGFIQELRLSTGMGHAGTVGAGVGGFLGLAAGALVGILTHEDTTCPAPTNFDELFCDDTSPRLVRAGLIGLAGAGIGLGVGYGMGSRFPRERWRPVPLEPVTVAVRGRDRLVVVGVRFRIR